MSDSSTAAGSTLSPELGIAAISLMLLVMQWFLSEARRVWPATKEEAEPGKYIGQSSVFLILYSGAILMGIGSAFLGGYVLFSNGSYGNTALVYLGVFLFAAAWLVLTVAPLLVVDEPRKKVFNTPAFTRALVAHSVVVVVFLGLALGMQSILQTKGNVGVSMNVPIAIMMAGLVLLAEVLIMNWMVVKVKSELKPPQKDKQGK